MIPSVGHAKSPRVCIGTFSGVVHEGYRPNYNDKLYCTEFVELAFRSAGLRLSHPIRWDALPGFDKNSVPINAIRIANGIKLDEYVIVAGNEQIGIWSSPALELVLDQTDVDAVPSIPGLP